MRKLAVLMVVLSACAGGEAVVATTVPPQTFVVDAWDGALIGSMCVVGEEDYGSGNNAFTPVRDGIDQVLFIEMVDEGCDATLTVFVAGRARSATYTTGRLYTGAEVQGTMSLTAPGRPPLVAEIGGKKEPPASLSLPPGFEPPRTEAEAPIWDVIRDSVCMALGDWFNRETSTAGLYGCPG